MHLVLAEDLFRAVARERERQQASASPSRAVRLAALRAGRRRERDLALARRVR